MRALPLVGTMLVATTFAATAIAQQAEPANRSGQEQSRKLPQFGTRTQEILLTKITVSDLLKSYDFYTKVIGLKLVTSENYQLSKAPTPNDPEREHVEIPLNFSGSTVDPIFLLIKQRGAKPSSEFARMIVMGFKVENSAAVVDRAVQAGYKPLREIQVGPAKVSYIADPDGYMCEIF